MEAEAVVRRLVRNAVVLCAVLWFLATYLTPDKIRRALKPSALPSQGVGGAYPPASAAPPKEAAPTAPAATWKPLKVRRLSNKILLVFVDEALQEPFQSIAPTFYDHTGIKLLISYGSSRGLAQKLTQGAYADALVVLEPPPLAVLEQAKKLQARHTLAHLRWAEGPAASPRQAPLTLAVLRDSQSPELADLFQQFLGDEAGLSLLAAEGFQVALSAPGGEP